MNNVLSRQMRKSQRELKKRLLRDVFRQRVGWERFRHSLRDHLGLFLELWITFRGQVHRRLAVSGEGGSCAFQLAQLVWYILDIHTSLSHFPWLHDVIAAMAGAVTWKCILPRVAPGVQRSVPYFIFPLMLFPFLGIILEEWTSMDVNSPLDKAPFPLVLGAVASTLFALRLAGIPLPLAASSLSGALLVYDSTRVEITGNWLHMMENAITVILPTLRLLWRVVRLPALWIWRRLIRRLYNRVFSPELTRSLFLDFVSNVRTVWKTVMGPVHKCLQWIADFPVTRKVNKIAQRLQRALRPVSVPLGIATWGVAVQMGYISGIGGVWRVFRMSLDPVAFVRGRVKAFFSPESRARRVVIRFLRSLPRFLGKRRVGS